MNILLIGSGGREHALAWKLKQSPRCGALHAAPGNPGIAQLATCHTIAADDVEGLCQLAQAIDADLVVVGPEAPLVLGFCDRLKALSIPVFGPSKLAAQLEGSKGFMKDLCRKYHIPTAAYARFTDVDAAKKFIDQHGAPVVVKADGLAAGKGVVVATSVEEAKAAADEMLSGAAFGDAGRSIVVESFLDGEEISYFALSDGKNIIPLGSAQDHKRVGDGDTGPNTGGMGAYSPARLMTPALEEQVLRTIIQPTVDGMRAEGCPFVGVLFAGLMVVDGVATLLEFNTRFGDPECQTLMMRLKGDLVSILYAGATGALDSVGGEIQWSDHPALAVVMAARGYPGPYVKKSPIGGLDQAAAVPGALVFHAGTGFDDAGSVVSTGGRVLNICATGPTVQAARDTAYRAVAAVDWPDGIYRKDIAWRATGQK